mmetsp:Transcript_88717/g.255843  ORF Transcript_88717/g.255843 Transcript_88717/m.255843 type:complete len:229 (-) Transcript_88717:284-970(-)
MCGRGDASAALGHDAREPRAADARTDPGPVAARQRRRRRQPPDDAEDGNGAHCAKLGSRLAQQHVDSGSRRRSLRAGCQPAVFREAVAGETAGVAGLGRPPREDAHQGQAVRPVSHASRADGEEPLGGPHGGGAGPPQGGGGRAEAVASRCARHVQAGRGRHESRRRVLLGRDGYGGRPAAGADRLGREVAQRHVSVCRALVDQHPLQIDRDRRDRRGRQFAHEDEDV